MMQGEDVSVDGEAPKLLVEFDAVTPLTRIVDDIIRKMVEAHGGDRKQAARALGISPQTILNRLGPQRVRIQNLKSAIENSDDLARPSANAQDGHKEPARSNPSQTTVGAVDAETLSGGQEKF